jgi:hypothetical protein
MASIAFNTPAFQREEISRIVFAQRRYACDTLIARGHEATAFIVADDVNLELADEFGFERVEHPNNYLGAKWNAGYRAAAGFDYVMPVGSDSLLDPALVLKWLELPPDPRRIPFTTHYSVIHRSGRKRVDCVVTRGGGGGMMLSAEQLAPLQYRPVGANLQKGCDHSTLTAVSAYHTVKLTAVDVHPLSVVALQSAQQITSYDALATRWGVRQRRGPAAIADLERIYGADVRAQVELLYTPKRHRR